MNYNWNEEKYFLKSEEKQICINMNTYQLCALRKVIDYISNSDTSWEYFSENGNKHYLSIIINDLSNVNLEIFKEIPNEILKLFISHICYDVTDFNNISIITYMKTKNENEDANNYINIINTINDLIYKEILYIVDNINECKYINNYFLEAVQLKKGNIVGFYDLGKVLIDGGTDITNISTPKIIKMQIQYKKIILPNIKYKLPCIESLYIDREILLNLIQLFLRCSLNSYISNGKYFSYPNSNTKYMYELDTLHPGTFVQLERNKIITEDYKGIPNDTQDLIDKFYKLDYDKQNLFLMSCQAYIEGLNSDYGKAITYYTIALENLANYFHTINYKNQRISKKRRIYLLLSDIFKREIIPQDFVNHFYNIRCLYSHEGIANNRIRQSIFEVRDSDEMMERYMEEITYSSLVQWLLNETI